MPEYEHVFFDDTEAADFVIENYPNLGDIYFSYPRGVQKSDLLRLLLIYHYGGFYFDTDVFLFRRLDSLLIEELVFPIEFKMRRQEYAVRHRGLSGVPRLEQIGNYGFGASKAHWFVGEVIREIVARFRDVDPWSPTDEEILFGTGPDVLNSVFQKHEARLRKTICLLKSTGHTRMQPMASFGPPDWNRFGDFGNHLCNGGWRTTRTPR